MEKKKKELKIEESTVCGNIKLITIVEYSCEFIQSKECIDCYGSKRPLYIVVITLTSRSIFRAAGEEITFEQLRKECPGLKNELERIWFVKFKGSGLNSLQA